MIDSAARGDISGGQMECQQRIEWELVIDINRFKPHHFEYYSSVKISNVENLILSYPFGFSVKAEKRESCSFIISIYSRLDVQVVEHL